MILLKISLKHPKPKLSLSLISDAYTKAYIASYHHTYSSQTRLIRDFPPKNPVQKQSSQKAITAFTPDRTNETKAFESGWMNGFNHTAPIDQLPFRDDPASYAAYCRGFKIGQRDYEFALAKKLKAQKTHHQKSQNQQQDLER